MTTKFIAYTFKGRKEVRSTVRDTREAAAQELFAANAKLHRVETAVATKTPEGVLATFGKDIRCVTRLEAAKALKQTPTTEPAKHMCQHLECYVADSTTLPDLREVARRKFAHIPLLWVVHVNAFTRKIESAYLMVLGVKNGGHITAAQFGREIAENPTTPVEFLSV